jgi:hypothetical protein
MSVSEPLTKPKPAPSFQDKASRKVAAFLAAGATGKIVLNVKDGRILAYEITEAGRISGAELDSTPSRAEHSEH